MSILIIKYLDINIHSIYSNSFIRGIIVYFHIEIEFKMNSSETD